MRAACPSFKGKWIQSFCSLESIHEMWSLCLQTTANDGLADRCSPSESGEFEWRPHLLFFAEATYNPHFEHFEID